MEHPFIVYIKEEVNKLDAQVRAARAEDYRNSNPVARAKIKRLLTAKREFETFLAQENN
ncbi:hypothetical protein VspSw1_50 [Vibrio phage VspSw_1]|uniref:Uncharacterized protein n=2 Tax=Pogseptimavirus VspSw1 TaxID=2733997 RepID=A0A411BKI9_9CAUD|nr:hypothetical protein HOV08_gp050 [Vibrio phage VspSw_1]QAY02123.1 hypothetical protein VspSw1_50 [Vibrio phage VspSw_1]QKN88444.1 hypothetical protein vBValSX1_51 [Vibrio phage vB_ValS_X1]